MKKLLLIILAVVMAPLGMMAQDDMYYVPKKADKEKKTTKPAVVDDPVPMTMSVDEYNRRHMKSSYEIIGTDSVGNDIIEFTPGDGSYPKVDTVFVIKNYTDEDDYYYSARMGLFDDYYGWWNPYLYGYLGYRWGHYFDCWYPWYHPWAYGLYDPWFNGWYYGYYPGAWGYYGWWNPWYYGYTGYWGYGYCFCCGQALEW